jgi:RNA polymerase sigma factor (sigma-70 family)
MSSEEMEFVEAVVDGQQMAADRKLIAAQIVEKVISTLAPLDRVAMVMIYSADYSLAEVANILGITKNNLKSRLFRSRNKIKGKFSHLF